MTSIKNNPAHYEGFNTKIRCIDIFRHLDAVLGTAFKYVWRAGRDSSNSAIQDLYNASWYLNGYVEWHNRFDRRQNQPAMAIMHLVREASKHLDDVERLRVDILWRIADEDIEEALRLLERLSAYYVSLETDQSYREAQKDGELADNECYVSSDDVRVQVWSVDDSCRYKVIHEQSGMKEADNGELIYELVVEGRATAAEIDNNNKKENSK